MIRLDWAGLTRAGMQGLGLTPDVFWSLTPAELVLMLGIDPGASPMTRSRLETLARAWPDIKAKEEQDDG
ncbi:MAG: rcc01693 family protein [Paracoccus sp. (in: a-proteobacteria)]